jgi:hypothetical protein
MSPKCCIALLLVLCCSSIAQNSKTGGYGDEMWEPPLTVDIPGSVKANMPKEMISNLRVGDERIVLDETQLGVVQGQLGGTIGHRGDAAESLDWLCLRGHSAQQHWVLWLMSGEINGGAVGGFRWQAIEQTTPPGTKCQIPPAEKGSVELPIAVRPGISEREVLRILGKPSKRVGDTLLYLYEHQLTIRNTPFWAMNTVAIILRGHAVWAIEVWKSTTS